METNTRKTTSGFGCHQWVIYITEMNGRNTFQGCGWKHDAPRTASPALVSETTLQQQKHLLLVNSSGQAAGSV